MFSNREGSAITSSRPGGRRFRAGLGISAVALGVVAAVVIGLGLTVLRGAPGFNRIEAFADQPVPAPIRPPFSVRVPGSAMAEQAQPVLPALSEGSPAPSARTLAARLAPMVSASALGKSVSVDVVDAISGEHLLQRTPAAPRTPASTAKLLTGAAALALLGPQSTLPTTVMADPEQNGGGQLVLVGGGDVLLGLGRSDEDAVQGHAGIATLAAQTAKELTAQGRTTVALTLDDGLFAHQSIAPRWSPSDVAGGFVAPVMPLEINAGRLSKHEYSRRSADPAMAAASAFATALKRQGMTVRGSIRRGVTPASAIQLAQVRSATVAEQVEFALTQSDNTVAEALARLVAVKSRTPATFAGGGQAVLAQVRKLGVPATGAVMTDGSGLGDGSRIPAAALTQVLTAAASDQDPQLRAVLSGLPVAAVSGTLTDRFGLKSQRPARGVVRAKTGTLRGVSSLAGTTVDADGRLLVFAILADKVQSTIAARKALDEVASTLAQCGCR